MTRSEWATLAAVVAAITVASCVRPWRPQPVELRTALVTGRVTWADGRPAADALVIVGAARGPAPYVTYTPPESTTCDSTGHYAIAAPFGRDSVVVYGRTPLKGYWAETCFGFTKIVPDTALVRADVRLSICIAI